MSEEAPKPIKYITLSTGPFDDLKFIGHSDAAEYDAEAGAVGACVETADVSDGYRSLLPVFHSKMTPIIEELTGVTRGVNEEATTRAKARSKTPDKVKPVAESFITFAKRALAAEGVDEEKRKAVHAQARALAASMKSDSSPARRAAGPGKEYLDKADAKLLLSTEEIEAAVARYLEVVPDFELERDDTGKPERESLAFLMKAWVASQL